MIDKSRLIVRINFYITKSLFAKSMADHYWTRSEEFPTKLTKKAAKEILKTQLRHGGHIGIDQDTWNGASAEFVQPWEDAFNAALEWISINYPKLQ